MPGPWMQLFNRSVLAFGSLFGGAAVVHHFFAPDMTVPQMQLPAAALESSEGFVPSDKFSGSRAGFVFKTGPAGLGYYPDQARK